MDEGAKKLMDDVNAKMVEWEGKLVALGNAMDKAKALQVSSHSTFHLPRSRHGRIAYHASRMFLTVICVLTLVCWGVAARGVWICGFGRVSDAQDAAKLEREKLNGDNHVIEIAATEQNKAARVMIPPYEREIYVITMIKKKILEKCAAPAADSA